MPLLFSLIFKDLNGWWIIPCMLLGFLFAWILYRKSNLENKKLKAILFTSRFILISLLAFLLLSPLLKSIQQLLEKPIIVIAQDASSSIASVYPKDFDSVQYHRDFIQIEKALADKYQVKVLNFGEAVYPGFNFNQTAKQTDFSQLFTSIKDQFSGSNIGAVILASDGIYNRGANPVHQTQNSLFPIYTIALGDTIPKKDLIVAPINYNNIVYLGNQHQIEIPLMAFQAKGANSILKITTSDGQVKTQAFNVNDDDWNKTFHIDLETRKKGLQKITIEAQTINGELSAENNKQIIFVEVIDGREKVLILADAPHPDISALKQAIEGNKNYEVKLAFADNLPSNIKDEGLIIFHALPSKQHPIQAFLANSKKKSRWFIIGEQSNTNVLNNTQNLVNMTNGNVNQDYLPSLNSNFTAFSLSEETQKRLAALAPIVAPFANYSLKNSGLILLNQQIGNIKTNAPLLAFGVDGGIKTGILTGEGIWRWRLEDFEKNENHEAFDELITKSVQYLSAKDDQRKFKVYPAKNRFTEKEAIVINAELYDDAYQLNNKPDVSLELKSKSGKKYSFIFSKFGASYQLNASFLPPDEYNFIAKTKLGHQIYDAVGEFLVEQINVELAQTTANHQLLYQLAHQTGGKMLYPKNMKQLIDLLAKNEKVKTISIEEKRYEELINLKWIFAILMLLLSFEWFLRKRNGAI